MLFTGRALTAAEAEAFGLIDRLVPAAELDAAVYTFATQIADLSQFTIRASKRLIQMALDGVDEDDREARRLFVDSFSGADFKEGVAAFIQKRKAYFPIA
jgi:enoyl-CoA hydratase/carnithine racemase